jgi:hypothetical protein
MSGSVLHPLKRAYPALRAAAAYHPLASVYRRFTFRVGEGALLKAVRWVRGRAGYQDLSGSDTGNGEWDHMLFDSELESADEWVNGGNGGHGGNAVGAAGYQAGGPEGVGGPGSSVRGRGWGIGRGSGGWGWGSMAHRRSGSGEDERTVVGDDELLPLSASPRKGGFAVKGYGTR